MVVVPFLAEYNASFIHPSFLRAQAIDCEMIYPDSCVYFKIMFPVNLLLP